MDTQYSSPAMEKSLETFTITYVKPAKPAAEKAGSAS
jgi:hypothetical protein